MSITVDELASNAEGRFAFLSRHGYRLANRECLFAESFKGGFILTYVNSRQQLLVEYLDMQLTVSQDGEVVFGAANHPDFAGNMFSREHLAEYMDHIARVVEVALSTAGANGP